MSALALDTHAAIKRLKEAGFTEAQAEAQVGLLADTIAKDLATKTDLSATAGALRAEIAAVRAEIAALRAEMKNEFAALRSEMRELELRLTIKLGVMMAASVAIVAALVKLL
ncbi:MAG: coiled-coil domain-containing protein [Pseudomonadota bacterium]